MLRFNTLLELSDLNPENVYLLRHEDSRLGRSGVFSAWFSQRDKFEKYQQNQLWTNRFPEGSAVASFVVPPTGETLFVGIYDVLHLSRKGGPMVDELLGALPAFDSAWHEMERSGHLKDYIGKLVIDWGAGSRSWRQRAHNQNKLVLELRPQFVEEPFPGHVSFICPLSDLNNLYPSWKTRLNEAKGVYLLAFDDGMQYVGSATGERGFLQRWENYLTNGHGGNRVLIRDNRDARNATVSILETSSSAQTDKEIIAREMHWQKKLGMRAKQLDDLQV